MSINIPLEMGIEIVTPVNRFYSMIVKAIGFELNARLRKLIPKLETLIGEKLEEQIKRHPTTEALQNGTLRTELGLVNPTQAVSDIISTVRSSVNVISQGFTVGPRSIKGGFKVVAIPKGFSDLLSLPIAQYESENGFDIPWLQWLLLEGRSPVVRKYKIQFNRPKSSRTDDAIMRMYGAGEWAVPAAHAGDREKNFITENLDELKDEIAGMVQKGLMK